MSGDESRTPIRVTLVLPATAVPAWLRDLYRRLQNSDFTELSVLLLGSGPGELDTRFPVFDLWMWLEAKAFGHKTATAENSESFVDILAELRGDAQCVRVTPDDLVAQVQLSDPGVIIWMLPGRPPPELKTGSNCRVLTTTDAFDKTFGLAEFFDRDAVTRCDVVAVGQSPAEDRVLVSSYAATDAVLFSRGLNGVRAKSRALLLSAVKRIWHDADPRIDGMPVEPLRPTNRAGLGNRAVSWGIIRASARLVISVLSRAVRRDQWQIAFRQGGQRLDQAGMRFLAPSHNGFWADPFIARRDERSFIFFEELSPQTGRGHLAAIEVLEDGQLGEPVDVLMRNDHLSYPFIFDYEGSLFMVPECGESGRVEALRCERFPDQWEPHAVLMENVNAFDPTLVEHDGLWWMFMTIQHDGNSWNDELHLFYANTPFEEWTPHPLNPVRLDVRAARPAGAVFSENGRLYRPGQDCSGRYGRAISIQEIRKMTTEEYEEAEVQRISAEWAAGAQGTHTVNHAHGLTVYDCEVEVPRWSGKRSAQ